MQTKTWIILIVAGIYALISMVGAFVAGIEAFGDFFGWIGDKVSEALAGTG